MKEKPTELRYFRKLNRFTTIAVYLTTAMLAYLIISSFISGAVSGADTNKAVKILKAIFGSDEVEPIYIRASVKKGNTEYAYTGDESSVSVTFYPSDAKNYPVSYSSSDEEVVSVDDDGKVTFLKRGSAKITVTVTEKPELTYSFTAYSYGKKPLDKNAELKAQAPSDEIKTGGKTAFILNDGETSLSTAVISSSDEKVVKIIDRTAYFVGAGKATITATFEDSTFTTLDLTVNNNPSAVYVTDVVFSENRTFLSGDKIKFSDVISGYKPVNGIKKLYATSSDDAVIEVKGETFTAKNAGTATVTFYSVYDEGFSKSVDLSVKYVTPTALAFDTPDTITVNGSVKLKAKHFPEGYSDKVTFTVVKGHGIIDANGNLKATFFDDITVGCQSLIDENLYVEKTFKIKLYSNFYSFVRKILGHFTLFALLGFGIWGSTFLLNNFLYSLLLSPGICFVCAGMCEMAQSITPGRYFSVADVFINFFGTLTGMALAVICVTVYCIVFRLINKSAYEKLKRAHEVISVKTVFLKRKKKADASR